MLIGLMREGVKTNVANRLHKAGALARITSLQQQMGDVINDMEGRRQRIALSMLNTEIARTHEALAVECSPTGAPTTLNQAVCELLSKLTRCVGEGLGYQQALELLRVAASMEDDQVFDGAVKCINTPTRPPSEQLLMLVSAAMRSAAAGVLPERARAHIKLVLEESGVSPISHGNQQQSPFEMCVDNNQLELSAQLICHAQRAPRDRTIEWTLARCVEASSGSDWSTLDFLGQVLECALDVMGPEDCVETLGAVEMACEAKLHRVAKRLVECGADCSSGRIFSLLCAEGWDSDPTFVERNQLLADILNRGGDLTAGGNLRAALQTANIDTLQKVIDAKPDLNDEAPVYWIVREMRSIQTEALLSSSEAAHHPRWTFLQSALDRLLEAGASTRQAGPDGCSALDMSLCVGSKELIWLMTLGGAEPDDGYPVHALLSMLKLLMAGAHEEPGALSRHCDYIRDTLTTLDNGRTPAGSISTTALAASCGLTTSWDGTPGLPATFGQPEIGSVEEAESATPKSPTSSPKSPKRALSVDASPRSVRSSSAWSQQVATLPELDRDLSRLITEVRSGSEEPDYLETLQRLLERRADPNCAIHEAIDTAIEGKAPASALELISAGGVPTHAVSGLMRCWEDPAKCDRLKGLVLRVVQSSSEPRAAVVAAEVAVGSQTPGELLAAACSNRSEGSRAAVDEMMCDWIQSKLDQQQVLPQLVEVLALCPDTPLVMLSVSLCDNLGAPFTSACDM